MFLNSDVLFSTADAVYGREIADQKGILIENFVISANLTAEETAAALDSAYTALAGALAAQAKEIGAGGVTKAAYKLDCVGDKLIVSLSGNAVCFAEAAEIPADPAEAHEEEAVGEAPAAEEAPAEEIPAEEAAEALEEAPQLEEIVLKPETAAEKAPQKVRPRYLPWTCHNCETTNGWQFQYCPKCGEIRHFPWKCSACGQDNPSEYRFCPGCGKTRSRNEEHIINYSEAEYKSMDKQALYDKLEDMDSAAEIYEYMRGLYGNETDDTIHAFLEVLRNNVRLEKLHGNGKIGTINQVKAFFDYGKRPFEIDYTGDTIVCPSCGHAQPANRKNCMRCDVMLVKR